LINGIGNSITIVYTKYLSPCIANPKDPRAFTEDAEFLSVKSLMAYAHEILIPPKRSFILVY